MRKLLFCFFITLLAVNAAFAQKTKTTTFKIDGEINVDTGEIKLSYVSTSEYYPASFHEQVAQIKNHHFVFQGNLPYPMGVILSVENINYSYVSKSFVITKGGQKVTCNIDSNREIPIVQNAVMGNSYSSYLSAFKLNSIHRDKLEAQWQSLLKQFNKNLPDSISLKISNEFKNNYHEHDLALLSYVKSAPNSYLGLWSLVDLLRFGYQDVFPSIFDAFSPLIKNSFTGKVLAENLKRAGALIAIGKSFPLIASVNQKDIKLNKSEYVKSKFTLIDFWYSNCSPCLAQFDDLKKIYKQYHLAGFQIIGISTDKLNAKSNWEKVIDERDLNWLQYWDKDGLEAKKLSINKFPTNFLLENGKIIATDLNPDELEDILKKNINSL